MEKLFPGMMTPERKALMQQFAASFGVRGMKQPTTLVNTRRALAVAEFARYQGKLGDYRRLTMEAYWKEGKDIENSGVLAALARASSLDPEKAVLAADDPGYLNRVDAREDQFRKVGVGGIPAFIFGREILEGCQPYDVLAAAAVRANAKRR